MSGGIEDSTNPKKISVEVYHCNDKERISNYVNDTELIIAEEDGNWLGTGMYFWDNLSNAKYWKKEKERKSKSDTEFSIASNYIEIDKEILLDLTDDAVAKNIQESWMKLCKMLSRDSNVSIGKKLNFIHEFYDDFDVIKAVAIYPGKKESTLFSSKINGFPYLTGKSKTIYLLKTDESILLPIIEIEG